MTAIHVVLTNTIVLPANTEAMNLCIDQGNSRTKVALFRENGTIAKHFIYKHFASAEVEQLFQLYKIEDSIISSVVNIEPAVVNALHKHSQHFILFDHNTPLPIRNGYGTPATLGQDRLAAAVGAGSIYPNENVLIIDAGSAITYDFLSEDGVFVGGNIAPGIKMRFTILHRMTKKLPLVEVEENEMLPLFGRNTRDAIAAGVVRGVVFEVKGYMRDLQEQIAHYKTIITGGNASYILHGLQAEVQTERHLVLKGLNQILQYNTQPHQ